VQSLSLSQGGVDSLHHADLSVFLLDRSEVVALYNYRLRVASEGAGFEEPCRAVRGEAEWTSFQLIVLHIYRIKDCPSALEDVIQSALP